MIDIVDRLRFDAVRCALQFSKGVAGNIDEAADEIERLRKALKSIKVAEFRDGETSDEIVGHLKNIAMEGLGITKADRIVSGSNAPAVLPAASRQVSSAQAASLALQFPATAPAPE
jgi:hypothetical protein